MSQARRTDDAAQLREVRLAQLRMSLQQQPRDIVAQRAAYTRYFQTVSEPVVDKNAAWKREDLRLVLQSPEWCRENQAIVIPLKFRTIIALLSAAFQSQPFAAQ